jgi:hypothetical protein
MCNFLVVTHDRTPEVSGVDLIKTAALTDQLCGHLGPPRDPVFPCMLLYSLSQEDTSSTGDIAQQAKSEFNSATDVELQACVEKLYKGKKDSG